MFDRAREKANSESWLVFIVNMMFFLFIGPVFFLCCRGGKESLVEL